MRGSNVAGRGEGEINDRGTHLRVMGQKIPKLPRVRADVRPRLPTLFFSLEWVLIKQNSTGAQMRSRNNKSSAKRKPVLTVTRK